MKQIKNYIGFLIALATMVSCNNSSFTETQTEEVTTQMPTEEVATEATNTNISSENSNDIGQVTIGNQIWSTKNLDVSTFVNGDAIPEATNNDEWRQFGVEEKPAWCYYDYNSENGKIYGKLYNWYAVTDTRGLAPNGWHVPTDADYSLFKDNIKALRLKMQKDAVSRGDGFNKDVEKRLELSSLVRSTSGWYDFGGQSQPGSNLTGFNALAGGYVYDAKDFSDNWFFELGVIGHYWCSNQSSENDAWGLTLIIAPGAISCCRNENKKNGASVRFIKD